MALFLIFSSVTMLAVTLYYSWIFNSEAKLSRIFVTSLCLAGIFILLTYHAYNDLSTSLLIAISLVYTLGSIDYITGYASNLLGFGLIPVTLWSYFTSQPDLAEFVQHVAGVILLGTFVFIVSKGRVFQTFGAADFCPVICISLLLPPYPIAWLSPLIFFTQALLLLKLMSFLPRPVYIRYMDEKVKKSIFGLSAYKIGPLLPAIAGTTYLSLFMVHL